MALRPFQRRVRSPRSPVVRAATTWRAAALRAACALAQAACTLTLAACVLGLAACERTGAERERVLHLAAAGRLGGLRIAQRAPILAPPAAERTLTVVATGDLKGWLTQATLYPRSRGEGLAFLAPRIADLRAEQPSLILLDAGDALLGAPSAALAAAEGAVPPIVAAMNRLRYDAMTLGNVDLGLGWPALARARAAADFPWLSANAVQPDGGTALAPYAVLERDGVRVGVLGLTTPAAALGRDPRALGEVAFTDLEAAARRWVPILRQVERVDVLIGLFHSGLDDPFARDAALRSGLPLFAAAGRIAEAGLGFDLIVAGDAQRLSPRQPSDGDTPYGTPVLEPGAFGNGLALATLRLRERGGRWAVTGVERRTLPAAAAPEPGLLAALAEPLQRTQAWLAEPTRVRLRRVPRKAEFYRCAGALSHAVAVAQSGEDAARVLSLLPMRWHYWRPAPAEIDGPLRRAHLLRWIRFDETLVQGRLTGRQIALLLDGYVRQLRGWRVPAPVVLWPGGLRVTLPEEGSELTELYRVSDGRALEPDETAPVWLTAFLWYGGLGLAPQALLSGGPPAREAPLPLRATLFALLSDPAFVPPPECARWLER